MSSPPDDKKFDLSSFPRGAIGIKGVPVNRNARLPSIRTPRDLTLGAQPKRTFLPNIPVRREKRTSEQSPFSGNASTENSFRKNNRMMSPKVPDRGKGRGRGRGLIIQTEGSVFGDGIAASTSRGTMFSHNKGKQRESSQRGSFPSGRVSSIKREKQENSISDISQDLANLMRDDFIDDGDDEKCDVKPVMFPCQEIKKDKKIEVKTENMDTKENFKNQDFAREMGFDVKKISKFIKKEKSDEDHVKSKSFTVADLQKNEISELLTRSDPQLLLLRFPECVTSRLPDDKEKGHASKETVKPSDQKNISGHLCSLKEGQIGKLQILKSGRTRLVIGPLSCNLDSVSLLKSKHEVLAVHPYSDTGDIVVLGNVNEKLSFAPDIESVLS